MIRYRKIIIGIGAFILLVCSVLKIYDINKTFPNTEDKAYRTGEETRYKGLKLTVGDVEIYTTKEFIEKYPNVQSEFDFLGDNYLDSLNYSYVIANITVENDTENIIKSGKIDRITSWVIETDMKGNGMDMFSFMALNPDSDGSFAAGEKQELKLPFYVSEEWTEYEKIKKEDIKIVFSYYPTKSYILYEGEK